MTKQEIEETICVLCPCYALCTLDVDKCYLVNNKVDSELNAEVEE